MIALVTGGGGFLGKAIVRQLLDRGATVRSFSRGDYPELREWGVTVIQGDIADAETVANAAERCDIVFHVAAKAGVSMDYDSFYQANVVGTTNVLQACRNHGISRLVYTSSPSVVFNGRDMEGVDESVPYPDHYEAHYPKTKAIAEKMVLEANGNDLATVALRPHLIWGPGDNHLVPRILERARAGRLRRIGKDDKLIDAVYIDNAADAHLLAAEKLHPGAKVAGKAFFITNDEPMVTWDLVNQILAAADLPPVQKTISPTLAYSVGWLLETVYTICNLTGEPVMTRFVARELATAHWFNIRAAKEELGYQPRVSMQEGLQRLEVALRADGRTAPSP